MLSGGSASSTALATIFTLDQLKKQEGVEIFRKAGLAA